MVSVIYVIILITNVFIMGWFTNEIMVQNYALGDALYQTEWYKWDLKCQKLLLFMLRQTQNPATLSIGPFGPITMETPIKIMQSAYSYITVMRNIK